ncbi:hypothetical protein [Laspinema olomoucense]|uniref:hypothetical protein n=1 Tax=Laspinema olomoucense TaxID=3231600 RepID=UPI0021BBB618|nr:hypothetical protein [Laspinema sp. D3d]MCT7971221.1 hypothetical protein [Laspinema sp. D3d]
MLRHSSIPDYPALFYPEPIERIQTGKPPEPSLSLIPLPFKPSAPPESQPPIFDCEIPQRFDYRWLGTAAIVTVVLGSIMGGLGVLGLFATTALAWWYWFTYPERQADYHRKHQKHQREIKQFHQQLAQQKRDYQNRLNAYQQEYDRIEEENQRLRFEHDRECTALRTVSAIEEWRTSQLNSVVLQPQLLIGQVDVSQFDPRSYAEFESNCEFPGLLKHYFGDKIHILRYLNGIIPHFSYVDEQARFSVAIEINVPYTPRQYPNSSRDLKLLHCIGQDEKRIKTFQSSDWFVLVFSERQVFKWPRQCCKALAQLIDTQTGTKLVKTNFQKVADVQLDAQWTEAMAMDMAKKQARLKYSWSYVNSHYSAEYTTKTLAEVLRNYRDNSSDKPLDSFSQWKKEIELLFKTRNGNKWHENVGCFPRRYQQSCAMWEDWKDLKKREFWIASLKAVEGLKKEPYLSHRKGTISKKGIEVLIECAEKQSELPWIDYCHIPLDYSTLNTDETQSSVFYVGESPSKTKNRVRSVIRKKFQTYMKHNPDLEATDEVKRSFVETFLEPDKEGFVTDWLHIKGVECGLAFIKDWTR